VVWKHCRGCGSSFLEFLRKLSERCPRLLVVHERHGQGEVSVGGGQIFFLCRHVGPSSGWWTSAIWRLHVRRLVFPDGHGVIVLATG